MWHLVERSTASSCLDLVKMKPLMPCAVEDRLNNYKCTIKEVVFDPLRIEEVNEQFQAAGYNVKDLQVIAVNDDDSILCWGGFNSVYHLKKGETIVGAFDNLAFNDIMSLTQKFKIKNKKVEIDAMVAQMKAKYSSTKDRT
jgi:phage terminase large subunit-like protein